MAETPRARWSWRIVFLSLALLFAARLALDPLGINPDSAMYLECGRQLLAGKLPYRDFMDLNPPLIMYLSTLPVLVARALGIHVILAFNLMVSALVLWSAWRFHRLLKSPAYTVAAVAASLLALYLRYDPPIVTGYRPFGQREHLMVLLVLPYLAARLLRQEGGAVERPLVIGLLAGIGVALKPHFLLVVAAPELYWLIRKRSLRQLLDVEILALAGVQAAYALHFLALPAAMRDAYFHRWAPLVWRGYDAFHVAAGALFGNAPILIGVTLVGLAVAARSGEGRHPPLALFTAAGLVLYFGQQKGWIYHLIPAWTGAFLLIASALERTRGAARDGARALFAGGLVVAALWAPRTRSLVDEINHQVAADIEAHSQKADPIALLSSAPWPGFPALVRTGRPPGTRYLWLFEVPMLERAPDAGEAARMISELTEDLARRRPALVGIAEGTCFACPPGVSLGERLQQGGLRLDAYRPLGNAGPFAWFVRAD